jgi:hypothetical protein
MAIGFYRGWFMLKVGKKVALPARSCEIHLGPGRASDPDRRAMLPSHDVSIRIFFAVSNKSQVLLGFLHVGCPGKRRGSNVTGKRAKSPITIPLSAGRGYALDEATMFQSRPY